MALGARGDASVNQCEKHPAEWGDHICSDCAWNAGFLTGIIIALIALGVAFLIFKLTGGHI
jgi:hypothetical protein